MQYSANIRKQIKKECKTHTLEHIGRCVGINFLYSLPFALLSILMIVSLYGNVVNTLMSGIYLSRDEIAYMIANNINGMWIYGVIGLFITGPLVFGMMKFYIGLRRGEEPGAGILFKPFTSLRSFLNGIKMSICLGFRSFIWMLIPFIIWFLVIFIVAFISVSAGSLEMGVGALLLCYVVLILMIIPISIKVMTYQAGWIVIHDNEQYGAWAATRDASSVFRGHYGKVVAFALSFLPWIILELVIIYGMVFVGAASSSLLVMVLLFVAAFCVSILFGAFVSTYMNTSFIGFYEYFVTAQHEQYNAYANQQIPQQQQPKQNNFSDCKSAPPQAPVAPEPTAPEQQYTDNDSDATPPAQ